MQHRRKKRPKPNFLVASRNTQHISPLFDFGFDMHHIPSPSGVPYFGFPNADNMRRATEIAKAEKVRSVRASAEEIWSGEAAARAGVRSGADATVEHGLGIGSPQRQRNAPSVGVPHTRRVEVRARSGGSAGGRRWKVTSDMTSKEHADYNKLLGMPKLDDEIKRECSVEETSLVHGLTRNKRWKESSALVPDAPAALQFPAFEVAYMLDSDPASISRSQTHTSTGDSRTLQHPEEAEEETVVMYIDESGDENDKDNEVELAVLPTLTSKQREYLESVGFFGMLEGKARAMEEKFRWEVEKQMMAHWRGAVQRRIQREVGKELRDKCQAQVQDIFEKHMGNHFLRVVAEEWGVKLGHEELPYLRDVGFPERVDEIRADVVGERYPGDSFLRPGNRRREGHWNNRRGDETKRRVAEEMRCLLEIFRGHAGSNKYFGAGSRPWVYPTTCW
ncbi:hypothetical protein EVG20_g3172 [Dentipellis fragilis]|uniref:Uncharacterized protein n=1 Tax=Dentipellis fragilis TaxID=205917 RepID=A0A4Y9Z6G1_9AGAM|nr:hypothetical protein EVG20_g3172 [Dentipellis fragilis]